MGRVRNSRRVMAWACCTMLSSGRNWLRSNQPPRMALIRPQSSSQARLPRALSHSLAMANCGWLSTSTRAACSQPRMIRASPLWG
ncbi:hypothetical protein FQZ97_1063660 [compost metagenome]